MPQCWALVLPRTSAVPWRGMEISKHVSHDRFQYIYLHDWITEVHQLASKSYYCLLLWILDKIVIKLGRDSWGSVNRIEAQWVWLCFVVCPMESPDLKLRTGHPLCRESLEKSALHDHWGGSKGAVEETGASGAHSWGMQIISGCIWKPAYEEGLKQGQALSSLLQITSWQNEGMFRLNQHLDEGASCAGHLQELPDLSTALTQLQRQLDVRYSQCIHHCGNNLCSPSFLSQGKPNGERNLCLLHATLCSHHPQSLSFMRTWIGQTAGMANEGINTCEEEKIPGLLWLRKSGKTPLGFESLWVTALSVFSAGGCRPQC